MSIPVVLTQFNIFDFHCYFRFDAAKNMVLVPKKMLREAAEQMWEETFLPPEKTSDKAIFPEWWRLKFLCTRGYIKQRTSYI